MKKLLVSILLLTSAGVYAQHDVDFYKSHNPSVPSEVTARDYAPDHYIDTARYPDGDKIDYVLTEYPGAKPKYAIIVMPGGNGTIGLQKEEDGRIFFSAKGNFLVRARLLFADQETVAVVTDRGGSANRMRGIVADLQNRYPGIKVYIAGTSYSTKDTLYYANKMDGEVAGFIHTSSVGAIDGRGLKSRNLVVGHIYDSCRWTSGPNSVREAQRYGTDAVMMEGGYNSGDECGPWSNHGFLGIEKETVASIKEWMKKGS